MSRERHVLLLIEYRQGRTLQEAAHAEDLGPGTFRLFYTPVLVDGIAAPRMS